MPIALAGLDIVIVLLAAAAVAITFYLWYHNDQKVQQIAIVGGALHSAIQWFVDRNEDIARWIINFSISLLTDALHLVNSWAQSLGNATFGALSTFINGVRLNINDLYYHLGIVTNQLNQIVFTALNDLAAWRNGFVNLNINALNFWRAQLTSTIDGFVIPNINKLINRVDYVTGLQIPTIQARLGVAERTIQQTLPAEIAETKTDISAVQRVISQTTTAPGTGLLDRATALEGKMAQVLPWAAAIGLSIPLARVLGRVARNPCYCLEETGQTDVLPLLMYLFEEAG